MDPRTVLYVLLLSLLSAWPARSQDFQLREEFGVSHPRQIVKFLPGSTTPNPRQSYMIGPNGAEVPYQVLSTGEVAVDTSLASKATANWQLKPGRPPQKFSDAVRFRTEQNYYEITNGLTGVRITRPENTRDTRLAPIQGILLKNGAWTATGPNYISSINDWWPTPPMAAKSASVRVVEKGPLEVTLEVSYVYDRPGWGVGTPKFIPGGIGFYKSTITVQAGQPSIMIEEDTDCDFKYSLNMYSGVKPTQARYRGHGAAKVEYGREADGRLYRPDDQRPPMDAFFDLQYQSAAYAAYATGDNRIRSIPAWDLWTDDSGWYWMLYDPAGAADAPVVGAFTTQASKAIGVGNAGPGVYTTPNDGTGAREAGFNFRSNRASLNGTVSTRVRIVWGIFVGSKNPDLGDPYQVQNISRQRNIHGGFYLTKISRYQTQYPDPPAGYGNLFMPTAQLQALIQRVKTDNAFYQATLRADPGSKGFMDLWRDTTGSQARDMMADIKTTATKILDALVNQDGVNTLPYSYWLGGIAMNSRATNISLLLTTVSLSQADRDSLKAIAALFAYILWDDDYVPLSTYQVSGLNLGTANMPIQQVQYRNLYALMLWNHPMMALRTSTVVQQASSNVGQVLNDSGAHQAGSGYISASMGPLLDTLQQLRLAGTDLFGSEPKLTKFAEFFMNLSTPPEPRYGGGRKMVAIGDSTTQGAQLLGQLATGFGAANPSLSSRLMEMWRQQGKPAQGVLGSTFMKVDESIVSASPALTSSTYPGWASVLRNGYGTPNESAIWFINGDFYSDHRHADHGSLVMYALGAPLSIDWGSALSPNSGGAYMHSMVVPEGSVGDWTSNSIGLNAGDLSPWKSVGQQAFERFEASTRAVARFQTPNGSGWVRSVYSIYPNDSYPAILISDNFDGPDAGAARIFSMNFMATGAVQSPGGNITPPQRTFNANGSPQELPSATSPMNLGSGINRFGFTGKWAIDWDLYNFSSQGQQALLGNWAFKWAPYPEVDEFRNTNGYDFEERQHILRIRNAGGSFRTLLLPYKKGTARAGMSVTQTGSTISVTAGTEQMALNEQFFTYSGNGQTALASYSAGVATGNGITITGGPAEVVLKNGQAIITAHGAPGARVITIPGNWEKKAPLTFGLGVYTLVYTGGDPVRVVLNAQ